MVVLLVDDVADGGAEVSGSFGLALFLACVAGSREGLSLLLPAVVVDVVVEDVGVCVPCVGL